MNKAPPIQQPTSPQVGTMFLSNLRHDVQNQEIDHGRWIGVDITHYARFLKSIFNKTIQIESCRDQYNNGWLISDTLTLACIRSK